MADAHDRDVVRKRRQEQAKAVADAAGRQLAALGTDLLIRGKAALLAAADAAANPHGERRERPVSERDRREKASDLESRTQSGQLATQSARGRFEITDQALIALLLSAAVGAAFGVHHADTHERTRGRRMRTAERVGNAANGTKVCDSEHSTHLTLCADQSDQTSGPDAHGPTCRIS